MHICVYCGANDGADERYLMAARDLGTLLAREGHVVVYGGAAVGLMGELATSALRAGGRVIGVIPSFLDVEGLEIVHRDLSELLVVSSLHERKAAMAARADAFVALPGGLGTFDELFETLTWAQLGLHRRPTFLVNVAHFFDPLLSLIDSAIAAGFVRPSHRDLFRVLDAVSDLPSALSTFQLGPVQPKWLQRS